MNERSYELPVHVHRDGHEPTERLTRAEDGQGSLDATRDDMAVGGKRKPVEDHALREVRDGEDVQGFGAVRAEQVSHCSPTRDDHAEAEHPATAVGRVERRLDAEFGIRLERMDRGGAQSAERNREEAGCSGVLMVSTTTDKDAMART